MKIEEIELKEMEPQEKLESEIEEIFKNFVKENSEYEYKRHLRIKGAGYDRWRPDFVLRRKNVLKGVFECKDIGGEKWKDKTKYPKPTFKTHMARAYTMLNDIGLKWSEIGLYVVLREYSYRSEWENIFAQVGIKLTCLKDISEILLGLSR